MLCALAQARRRLPLIVPEAGHSEQTPSLRDATVIGAQAG
jgi:hypothetical protein